jgi:hypothetical protein
MSVNKRKYYEVVGSMDFEEIITLLYALSHDILIESLLYKEHLFEEVLSYLDIKDISRMDCAMLSKDLRPKFHDSVKKVKFFDPGNFEIIVDENFCEWFFSRGIGITRLHYQLIFEDQNAKHLFLSNCFNLVELDTDGFEYTDLRIIVQNNPTIQKVYINFDNFHYINDGENYEEDANDICTNFKEFISFLTNITEIQLLMNDYYPSSYNFLIELGEKHPNIKSITFELFETLNGNTFIGIVSKLTKLEEIIIDCNDRINSSQFYQGLINCKELKKITIKSTEIDGDTLCDLSIEQKLTKVIAPVTFYDSSLIIFCTINKDLEELSVENSQENITNSSLSHCFVSCKKLKILNIKNTFGSLDFLLDSFNLENPNILPSLQIIISPYQYTATFGTVYENEKYAMYFENITIVVDNFF